MKKRLNLLLIILSCCAFPSYAWWLTSTNPPIDSSDNKAHNEWLTKRFSEQHQQLIPIVAVADMFFSCNQARKTDKTNYQLSFLINKMDRNNLAEKLGHCLGEDTMQSEVALNFGLFGCSQDQLAYLVLPSA